MDYWILILTAGFFAARMAQRSHNRRLRAAKSAMAHARARDARYTSVETGMLEWINHVLRHEWRAVIGVQVDAQAKRTMQSVMSDANAMSGGIVRSATVEELTFGVVPPDLRMYVSRYNPAEDYLQFEFDMTWNTVSSHILVRATVQPTDLLPPSPSRFTSPTSPSPGASSSDFVSRNASPASPAWTSRSRTNPR